MAFQYLGNTDLEDALAHYIDALSSRGLSPRTETVPVSKSLGRVTAAPVYARISAPHYNASAMDGIAIEARETFGATATTPIELAPAQYVVVDTGDPMPPSTDAVVMVEDVICDEALGTAPVSIHASVAPWTNVRQIGEDICAGEMIATSGIAIEPATIGAMIAAGVSCVEAYTTPVIGIIPTGDEVVPPSENPSEGDVVEFNSSIFSGMFAQWGAKSRVYDIVPDELPLIIDALKRALGECDGVLLIAGSSAGRDDYASAAIGDVGEVAVHGLAIKPGKPAVLGIASGKPVIGMPGYPVSGIVVMEQVVKPLIERLVGIRVDPKPQAPAILGTRLNSSLKYREYVRVRLGFVDGRLIAAPLPRGAGIVSSFMKADGIIEIPQNYEGFDAGEEIPVRLMRPLEDLEHTLVVVGSHDPIIDEITELLHALNPGQRVASTHVGSMGALVAAKRRENHCGGIHLLDESTGEYNAPYLRKHFPEGGVQQMECVYRQQGLMIAPGNPKNIKGMEDLLKPGVRFVNRQKGSGTRILSDFLCKQDGIDTSTIVGYEREVFTHLEVAALVQANSADAGMGVYSAAKQYGLDFIPLVEEQYDLLIPDYALHTPMIESLVKVLKSDAFRKRALEMGGYRIDTPGAMR